MQTLPVPDRPRHLPSRLAVGLEVARALAGSLLLPLRLADFYFRREDMVSELRSDLEQGTAVPWQPQLPPGRPSRPLRVFVSCAETSGEIHAAGFVARLRARLEDLGAEPAELIGLGGARLRSAGVQTIEDPVARATMGLRGALAALPYYLDLLSRSGRALEGCDLAVLVDSPALHVPLGRIARRAGARVLHFVAPQYWGWAPWRTASYRGAVDRGLTILPFEPDWFARRGVPTLHVGHPLLDALPAQVPSPADPDRRAIALLPGSRRGIVRRNLPWMLAVLRRVRARLGDVEVVLPHADGELAPLLREELARAGATGWVRLEPGNLHASLARARAAFSVSGTILVDLLHQRIPTVVVYGLGSELSRRLSTHILLAPWFALPNLLAAEEVLPEFAYAGEGIQAEVGAALERCYNDEAWRRRCIAGLERAARRLGPPGALDRAVDAALDLCAAPPSGATES
jgi:lipid-A-disaccharide synthase